MTQLSYYWGWRKAFSLFPLCNKTHTDYGLQEQEKGLDKSQGLPPVCLKLSICDSNTDIALTSIMPLSAICKAGGTGFPSTHHDKLCYRLKEIMFI